ncbi:hypothetical protein Tco_0427837 [Tanacetum coccineum]
MTSKVNSGHLFWDGRNDLNPIIRSNESSSVDVVERDGANPSYSSPSSLLRLEASVGGSLKNMEMRGITYMLLFPRPWSHQEFLRRRLLHLLSWQRPTWVPGLLSYGREEALTSSIPWKYALITNIMRHVFYVLLSRGDKIGWLFELAKWALKCRSSVLDDDIGSGGPLRRTRQKANLLTLRDKRELGYTALQQLDHASQKLLLMNESEPKIVKGAEQNRDTSMHGSGSVSGYANVPTKSTQTATKILQHHEKMDLKEKSSGSTKSPTKLTLDMLHGQALRSLEKVDSPKLLSYPHDNQKSEVQHHERLHDSRELTSKSKITRNMMSSVNVELSVTSKDKAPAVRINEPPLKLPAEPHQKKRAFQLPATLLRLEIFMAISVSSDSSEDSVGTPVRRVILFGTIPTTILDTTPVITPPTTQTDTIEIPIIAPTIPPLLAMSPFLSSADDTIDSDTPDTPPSPTHDSSSEASSDFHSDASSDSSSRHSLLDHSSLDLPSTSAGPSRKRRKSPMTSVPALPPISGALSLVHANLIPSPKRVGNFGYLTDVEVDPRETSLRDDVIVKDSDEPHLEQDIDLEIQAEIDECFAYANALRDRGINARVVVEAVDREESETGVRGPVEVRVDRVTHLVVADDIPMPAQEGAVEVTYETLEDLVQRFHDHTEAIPVHRIQVIEGVQREQEHRIVGVESAVTALTERIDELERDNRRLRGTASVESGRVDRLQHGEPELSKSLNENAGMDKRLWNGGNGEMEEMTTCLAHQSTEDGVTRLKEYVELTPAEAIQADCDIKAINIILQGLPTEIYALVSQHRVAKDLWEKIKLLMQGTSLTKQERECKLYDEFDKFTYKKGETLHEYYLRFTLLLNDMNIYKMPLEQFQVNTKFLNTLPDEWSKFVTDVKLVKDLHTTNIDQLHAHLQQHERHAIEVRLMHERNPDPLALVASHQLTQPAYQSHLHPHQQSLSQHHVSPYQHSQFVTPYQHQQFSTLINTSFHYDPTNNQSTVHHNVYSQQPSIPQSEYAPITYQQQQPEFSQPDSSLVVPVFQKGDDPIDAINHMMSFLTAVVTSRYPTTNKSS